MKETRYADAAVEVLDILNYTRQDDVKKIPQSFIKFLVAISNKKYKVNFNHARTYQWIKFKERDERNIRIYIYNVVVQ